MREYGFELRLCAHLERDGLPGLPDVSADGILGRQLGTSVHAAGGRIVDVVYVEPGPDFGDRVALTAESIPEPAIEADVGVGRFVRESRAIDGPPERARRIAERAAEIGFYERDRRDGRDMVRQVARYPDWYGRIVGIENKPDLGTPGDLTTQLRTDASLGVLDAAILATESYVTGAHLNRLPDPVGVWRVHPEPEPSVEVIREPTPLDPERPGIEPLAWHTDRTDVRVVSADAIATQRRRIAERVYGKGWRTFAMPACKRCVPNRTNAATLPYCEFRDRVVNPADECTADCPGHEPADPPDVDLDAERARRTAWEPAPAPKTRRQADLDRFS
ncbi:DUF5787 family protein [Halanaeroarchaeum sulfurireducens]|uniref:Uncharacterized protein n=1 Tax=Halanaeroarchaeum sulfurireducens TaxID=1604004 RepID=A0A0F7PBB5_9EURY|nr:DUF5787 family protein [Halanaeroarchaeum sulfurireducens]AKH98456.1 hypothetical protein HLASF_1989 [Halanaeroarchaeum sulfurireducens]ALG82850.1 hypothetical protein HLASA_1975 [Halanaeroarchaeum sulfurireducens]